MDWAMICAITALGVGGIVIVASIIRSRDLFMAMPFVAEQGRIAVKRFIRHHRLLMVLFLVGYVITAAALLIGLSFFDNFLMGAVCFFIAVFIYFGSVMESKLLAEIQGAMTRLLPICAICKKIRRYDSDERNPESWQAIDEYLSNETGSKFTHGFCPDCAKILLRGRGSGDDKT